LRRRRWRWWRRIAIKHYHLNAADSFPLGVVVVVVVVVRASKRRSSPILVIHLPDRGTLWWIVVLLK